MSDAVAALTSDTPQSLVAQTSPPERAESPSQHATRFVLATAQLLEQLTLGATGSALAPLLNGAVALLRQQNVQLTLHADTILVNNQTVPRTLVTSWLSHLQQHGIQRVSFNRDASEAELLHFLALLAGPKGDVPCATMWLQRGAWRIHIEVADVSDDTRAVAHDAVTLLDKLVSAGGALRRDVTDEELDLLSHAVARGVSVAEGSPLLVVLRRAGERAVKSLLTALADTASGSQRRTLFETVALLNVGHQYLIALLTHPMWYVVRNAALLLGELRVEAADTALASLREHPDYRVRTAAVIALGALHSDVATESLHLAVSDRSAEVRAAAWRVWQHRDYAPCVDTVNRALREESDRTVQRAVLNCVAHFDDLDVAHGLVRFCAHGTAHAAPLDLLAFGIDLLAQRRPQSARQFIRHIADVSGR